MSDEDAQELAEWEQKRLSDYQAHRDAYPDEWYPGQAEARIRELERVAEQDFERIARHEAGHAVVDCATDAHIVFMSVKPEIHGGHGQVRVRGQRMVLWIHRLSRPESEEQLAIECQRYLAGEAAERLTQSCDDTVELLAQWSGAHQDAVMPKERYELREMCPVVLAFFGGDVAAARSFIAEQYQRAVALLRARQSAITALVDRLRVDRSLVGEEVRAIVAAAGARSGDRR